MIKPLLKIAVTDLLALVSRDNAVSQGRIIGQYAMMEMQDSWAEKPWIAD